MPLIRVYRDGNVIKSVFFAGEAISHLASLEIASGGGRYVRPGSDTYECRAAGVAIGGVSSGELVRAVTQGIVSGVICIGPVNAGDRVTLASGGRITPLNTITPLINLISGTMASGQVGVDLQALSCTSGLVSGVTGIRPFDTAMVLGKAIASGLSGYGVQLLVTLGG